MLSFGADAVGATLVTETPRSRFANGWKARFTPLARPRLIAARAYGTQGLQYYSGTQPGTETPGVIGPQTSGLRYDPSCPLAPLRMRHLRKTERNVAKTGWSYRNHPMEQRIAGWISASDISSLPHSLIPLSFATHPKDLCTSVRLYFTFHDSLLPLEGAGFEKRH